MNDSEEESGQQEKVRPYPGQGGKDAGYPAKDPHATPDVTPGVGGYDDRDPESDMPRVPTEPETQDE